MAAASTHRAIILQSPGKRVLETVPKPLATAGSAVVKVLATSIGPYFEEILDGKRPFFWMSLPMIPGQPSIGRIESVGPDAVSIEPGQLVLCDYAIRPRDDADIMPILHGMHGGLGPSRKLMSGEWRHGSLAEYVKLPLENVFPLNEELLLKDLGLDIANLLWIQTCLVPYGGLSDINVLPGDTVIVAPATGKFGGAAVCTALAMGANVIAAGRDTTTLQKFIETYGKDRVTIVTLTEDVEMDTAALIAACPDPKGADAYIDFGPPGCGTTHLTASLGALKPNGRCSLMGGINENISIPYAVVMFKNIRIQGIFMYTRAQVKQFIKLVEAGSLKLGKASGVKVLGPYSLDTLDEALKVSAANPRWGTQVVLTPKALIDPSRSR